ncbi:tyrosine-type recombinase/integrase [Zophobihabitans entericus]|uniref:Integrase arm-type DNA-binding domain-containing protein n=1 Tax=Zophobihabitans entericus TaxID=1635327 RepID=A0A6G9IED8_9GAMM|nr:integrase arm-type DNA-binding domain-containing protein [Zophobihabitans entericus]QIQ22182.1 integrase arm-type DNA-binding domain-containing protein [Zophobihabitans entericus]
MALTDTAVRQAKAKKTAYSLKDIDGLFLYIAPNGTKSWHFRYNFNSKAVRISFGTYPELSLKDARQYRDEARSQVAKGIDPRVHKQNQQSENILTFAKYIEHWKIFKLKKLGSKNPNRRQSTQVQIERYLRKDLLPALGELPMINITRVEILAVLRSIEGRGALSIAEKCRCWLNEIFRFALAEGVVQHNPASDMDILALPQNPVKHNPFLTMAELPPFLAELHHYKGGRVIQLGVKLLLLTGVRSGELRYAEPSHFDLEKGLWNIPADMVKQLKSQVRNINNTVPPYVVPLSRQAIDIVKEMLLYRYSSSKYLIVHRYDPNLPCSENTFNQAIKRMGYHERLTGHGLRATLSTALNELGYQKEWIEAQLSHSDKDQVRRAYNHAQYIEQRRGMMQDWADKLDGWTEEGVKQQITT